MIAPGEVSASVSLAVGQEPMWRAACSLEGINYELGPLLRMTRPRGLRDLEIDDVRPGARLGRSWLLLGGLVPVDYDDLGIAELEPPRRFLERSTMLTMRAWEHERVINGDSEHACVLTDRLRFELRRPLAAALRGHRLPEAIVARIFRHRHARLRRKYGSP